MTPRHVNGKNPPHGPFSFSPTVANCGTAEAFLVASLHNVYSLKKPCVSVPTPELSGDFLPLQCHIRSGRFFRSAFFVTGSGLGLRGAPRMRSRLERQVCCVQGTPSQRVLYGTSGKQTETKMHGRWEQTVSATGLRDAIHGLTAPV